MAIVIHDIKVAYVGQSPHGNIVSQCVCIVKCYVEHCSGARFISCTVCAVQAVSQLVRLDQSKVAPLSIGVCKKCTALVGLQTHSSLRILFFLNKSCCTSE